MLNSKILYNGIMETIIKTVEITGIFYPVYADLEDAFKYNNAILGGTWENLDETSQAKLLVMATRKIDSYHYAGQKLDEKQPLKFPRIMRGGTVSDNEFLTLLCCKIATFYNDNGGYTSSSSGSSSGSGDILSNLKDYKIGDLQVTFKDDAKIDLTGLDNIVEEALSDWIKSNSMEIWL